MTYFWVISFVVVLVGLAWYFTRAAVDQIDERERTKDEWMKQADKDVAEYNTKKE